MHVWMYHVSLYAYKMQQKYLSAEEVRKYLEMENEAFQKMPGHNPAGISAQPIRLTIAGRDLPTLTIVDLPGMSLIMHWPVKMHDIG